MQHGLKKPAFSLVFSCRWPDSNRHGSLRMILSHVRLPIPPHRQGHINGRYFRLDYSTISADVCQLKISIP